MFLVWPTILLVFYGLLYYFSTIVRGMSVSVYRNMSVYNAHCACAAQVHSHLSFFKLTDMLSEALHETCSFSYSGDKNFVVLYNVRALNYK